jgi:hypothetical protein
MKRGLPRKRDQAGLTKTLCNGLFHGSDERNLAWLPVADHFPKANERYFNRYTTVVSVAAGSGVGSPYISQE